MNHHLVLLRARSQKSWQMRQIYLSISIYITSTEKSALIIVNRRNHLAADPAIF